MLSSSGPGRMYSSHKPGCPSHHHLTCNTQVSGVYNGVKKACHMIIDRVREALQKGTLPAALQPGGSGSAPPPPGQRPGAPPPSYGGPPPPYGAPPPAAPPPSFQVETTYKILMPDSRVGALIGKGGEVSGMQMRQDGCSFDCTCRAFHAALLPVAQAGRACWAGKSRLASRCICAMSPQCMS